jgi:heme O synthase-like polyprenyltransferase
MNRLRLFNLRRNNAVWRQWLRLTGRRNNRGIIWTILSFGLGIAATAAFNMRRGENTQYMMKRPIRRAVRNINGFMNRRMRRPSLATVELSKEITEKPKNMITNNRQ